MSDSVQVQAGAPDAGRLVPESRARDTTPTMTVFEAYRDGVRRVAHAPVMLVGLLAASMMFALPFAIVVATRVAADLRSSVEADSAATGVNWTWWEEFSARTPGLASTLKPRVIGFAAPLSNLSALLDVDGPPDPATVAAVALWLTAWCFLSGGVLDRYARDRRTGAHGFFMACGVHFFRFMRLAALSALVYIILFAYVHGWLLDDLYGWLTRSLSVERTSFVIRLVLYALFGAALVVVNAIFDYARIRIVVEDRHSALSALDAGLRFFRRRWGRVMALYTLNAAGFLVALALYAFAAPGATGGPWHTWLVLFVGQAFILARLWVKLQFYASQTAFFQGTLAHAGYVAAPDAKWPESPAVEAVRTV